MCSLEALIGLGIVACVIAMCVVDMRRGRIERSVAFFHPFSNAGGGGEFVLWSALIALAEQHPELQLLIYTGATLHGSNTATNIIDKAVRDFGFSPAAATLLHQRIRFVHVRTSPLAFRAWPRATLFLQMVFGVVAAVEAVFRALPEVVVDTAGAATTLPVFRVLGGCKGVAAYVHYPSISSAMIADVVAGTQDAICNQRHRSDSSRLWTRAKVVYYSVLTAVYGAAGGAAHVTMVNGTWTAGHIARTWHRVQPMIVFPPCSVVDDSMPIDAAMSMKSTAPIIIVSIGQFRPEKRQIEQVRALHRMLLAHPEHWGNVRLVLVGTVRGPEDAARKDAVIRFAAERGLLASGAVVVPEHVDAAEKRELLNKAAIGLHAMRDEHFGICVVEYMAHGAVPLAHNSAGPRMDIVVPALTAADVGPAATVDVGLGGDAVGMLAETEVEYAECLHALISRPALRIALAKRARARAVLFSPDRFRDNFLQAMNPLITTIH